MGRNAQPIDILVANGKKHLTKAEIESRKKSQIKLGTSTLKCPDFVKKNEVAYRKWKEIIKLYKDIDFVSSGDVGLLGRYCMSFSEYQNLLDTREKLNNVEVNWDEYESVLPQDFTDSINKLLSLNPLMQIEAAVNKKTDMLIKMEDRLFLTPLSKIKNIPKPAEEKPKNKFEKYGAKHG